MRRPLRDPFSLLFLLLDFVFVVTVLMRAHAGATATPTVEVPVGVVLAMGSVVGRTGMMGLEMAVKDFYEAHPNYTTRIRLVLEDSQGDDVVAAAAVISLLKDDGVQAIIGPQTSGEAEFIADLANKTQVPVLSFSATSPFLGSKSTPYFLRTAVNDSAHAAPIAALVKKFEWKQAVMIYQDSEFGSAAIPSIIDALREVECRVPYHSVIPCSASDDFIKAELFKLKTMQTRVFIVHTIRSLGTRILTFAADDEVGMMSEGYAWIVTDEITSMLGVTDSPSRRSIQRVLGLKPYIPESPKRTTFELNWKRQYLNNRTADPDEAAPSQFVLWAYDTAFALATAVELANLTGPAANHISPNPSNNLAAIGPSPTGPRLLHALSTVRFQGLSGEFRLVDGQIWCKAFEIVSFTRTSEVEIGFWTADRGLTSSLEGNRGTLAPVTWPGETVAVPKGWEEPVTGRRLRIAVPGPADPGFHAFLQMDWDPVTNVSTVGGFVVDVFEAAVKQLPYAILWDYVPFQTKDGKSAGNYNDLVRNVSAGVYDGVVGDVTITEDRAEYVDFTMPYITSGVSMVVPNVDYQRKSATIFFRPFKWQLWLVSLSAFIATGGVIWTLEYQDNEELRGGCINQLFTIFYFTFSTLVYAHREKIVSNWSRIVIVVWLFVVLILQSSYTASLTSMLTVQQLRPKVAEIADLVKSGQRVGYLEDSFMKARLLEMNFTEKNLVPLVSPQKYAEMLARGSDRGGVAAIIDETPYLRLFLQVYCSNYTMAGHQLKTGGFGFAFSRGSPLVPDLSRAILKITESETMTDIEHKWFGNTIESKWFGDVTTCPNSDNLISSKRFNFLSFWVLFLITGCTSLFSLTLFLAKFVYDKRDALSRDNGEGSILGRVKMMWEVFDLKEQDTRAADGSQHVTSSTVPPNGNETPPSMSYWTDSGSLTVPQSGNETPLSTSSRMMGGSSTVPQSGNEIPSIMPPSQTEIFVAPTPCRQLEMTPNVTCVCSTGSPSTELLAVETEPIVSEETASSGP